MHIILFVLRNAIGIEEWHGIFSFGFMTYNLIFLPFEYVQRRCELLEFNLQIIKTKATAILKRAVKKETKKDILCINNHRSTCR